MPRSTIIFLLILSILAALLGYNYFAQPFANLKTVQVEEEKPAVVEEKEDRADEAIIGQELAQLIAFPYLPTENISTQSARLSWIRLNQPGVVTLFGSNISTSSAQAAIAKIKVGFNDELSPLIAVDHEGGSVQRLSGTGFTDLPSWKSICATSSTQRQNLLTNSAQELAQVGIDIIFAPVIDVASRSAVLKDRVCSSDSALVTERASEFIDIFRQNKIISVIKHYPGIGSISQDLHRQFDQVEPVEAELLIFKNILNEYPLLGVMSAHVGVKNLYEDTPCSLNEECIGDLTSHFPKTLVFTDALDMDSAGYVKNTEKPLSLAERSVLAIRAGNDVLVFGPNVKLADFEEVFSALKTAYRTDEKFKMQAESSVHKIRQYKASLRP